MALLSDYLARARANIAQQYASGRVLDLGCGNAETYRLARHAISEYHGIDLDPAAINRLRAEFPEASFHVADLDEDPLPDGIQVDTVLLIALIEHIFNQKHMMREIVKCLAPSGRVVVTTPTPLGNDVVHRIGGKIGIFAGSAVRTHIVIYNRPRLEILASEFGLVLDTYKRFQLGCNQLAILKKPDAIG